jgi:hypothetical protein
MFHVKHFLLLFLFLPLVAISQHMGSTTLIVKELPRVPIKDVVVDSYLNQFAEASGLTGQQKEWFYWTNYSRSNPRRFWDSVVAPLIATYPNLKNDYSNSLKNDLYNVAPLPLLKPNINLIKIAQKQAKELAEKEARPSHTSPAGVSFSERMKAIGVKKCAGENISFGPGSVPLMLTLLYIDEGVPDLGHRKTLLSPSFVEMGIGIGNYSGDRYMVIQDFACSQQ